MRTHLPYTHDRIACGGSPELAQATWTGAANAVPSASRRSVVLELVKWAAGTALAVAVALDGMA